MLIIARTTGVKTVVMMVIVTHESYDSVLVGTGKQKVVWKPRVTAQMRSGEAGKLEPDSFQIERYVSSCTISNDSRWRRDHFRENKRLQTIIIAGT